MIYKNGYVKRFKGYGLVKINGCWRAECYANPTFYNTNLTKLKQQITKYLNSNENKH